MKVSACQVFVDTLRQLDRWMVMQPAVGEESLTDWLLFRLSEQLPSLHYRKFTRHQEGRETGADWEWWFVGPRLSVGIRVQAKHLHPSDNYPALAYANRHGLQIERLRRDAARSGLLAFYAFYAAGQSGAKTQCGRGSAAAHGAGAFVVDANSLYNAYIATGRAHVAGTQVLASSIPMSCLACCSAATAQDRDARIPSLYNLITSIFSAATEQSENFPQSNAVVQRGLHVIPPSYVTSLLEANGDPPSWWEGEFSSATSGVNALVVWDLRSDDV